MNLILRQENQSDHKAVFDLIQAAFQNEEYSDHTEHFLVERLRKSEAFVPELSIVAESDGKIIGHILIAKIQIINSNTSHPSLALAPVSVHPDRQRKGIGSQLIQEAHKVARKLDYKSIVVLGHEDYYPKFGYERSDHYNIQFPFGAPPQNCMVKALVENGLKDVSGTVEYNKAFFQ